MPIDQSLLLKAEAEFELRRRKRTFREYLEMTTPEFVWDAPHLELDQRYLQEIADGASYQIIVLKPPRHGKSAQNTVRFGSYYLYKNPTKNVILGAYNQEYSNDLSLQTREIYRDHMPNEQLKNTEKRWLTSKGGGYKAAGLLSGVTGKGGDLILIDDPVKGADIAYSKSQRDKMWRTYRMDFRSRLEPGGSIILTMTPWHHDGLVNRILNSEDGKNWIVIKMPALAVEDDILGRKPGEALWPERWPREELLKIKAAVGDDEFNALYQVNPIVLTGNIVDRSWFTIESTKEWPIRYDRVCQFWDGAVKKGQNNDYYACATLAQYKNDIYLLNMFRAKMTYPEFREAFIEQSLLYKPDFIGVEDTANGSPLIQEFANCTELPVKPEAIKVSGDKEMRVRAITGMLCNNHVKLPKGAHWIVDFLDEICLFPQAKHDDQVDAFSMGMNNLRSVGYSIAGMVKAAGLGR